MYTYPKSTLFVQRYEDLNLSNIKANNILGTQKVFMGTYFGYKFQQTVMRKRIFYQSQIKKRIYSILDTVYCLFSKSDGLLSIFNRSLTNKMSNKLRLSVITPKKHKASVSLSRYYLRRIVCGLFWVYRIFSYLRSMYNIFSQ